jgi:YtkA-like
MAAPFITDQGLRRCPWAGGLSMSFLHRAAGAVTLAFSLLVGIPNADAAAGDYRFELAGNPQAASGKSIVAVKLTHTPDNKPVAGAIIIQTRADMGPDGMKEMTAPVKALPPKEPGVYLFEVETGMAGGWMLTLAAKVQGEAETVRGSVTVKLAK